jgi:hypothetical protein
VRVPPQMVSGEDVGQNLERARALIARALRRRRAPGGAA